MTFQQKNELHVFVMHLIKSFGHAEVCRVSGYSEKELAHLMLSGQGLCSRLAQDFYQTATKLSQPLNPASNAVLSLYARAK